MEDRRRLNVAITRAKMGLIIIGNPITFYNKTIWLDLVDMYRVADYISEEFSRRPFSFPISSNVKKTIEVAEVKEEFFSCEQPVKSKFFEK